MKGGSRDCSVCLTSSLQMIQSLMKEYLRGVKAKTILEVGPGYGNFSRIATELTGADEVTYFDCDEKVLSWQAQKCVELHLKANYRQGLLSPKELDKISNHFDLILCQEVLEHLSDPELVLKALSLKLSAKGQMIITVPTKISERWLKFVNPAYMRDEPFGHVREFDQRALRELLESAALKPLALVPTQPHYFVSHTWLYATRVQVEGSTGRMLAGGLRTRIHGLINSWSYKFFTLTGPTFWSRLFPRNYFVLAVRK